MADDKRDIPWAKCRWRIDHTNQEKTRGFYVPYFDARAVAEQLDEWVGWDGWSDHYQIIGPITGKKEHEGVLCIITVYKRSAKATTKLDPPISKSGMAEFTTFETVKGGESGAFKRAGAKLGVGRAIYKTRGVWAPVTRKGDKVFPADNVEQFLNKRLSEQLGEEIELEVEKPVVDEHAPEPAQNEDHQVGHDPEPVTLIASTDEQFEVLPAPAADSQDEHKWTKWCKRNVFDLMGRNESIAGAAYNSALRSEDFREPLTREQAAAVIVKIQGQVKASNLGVEV